MAKIGGIMGKPSINAEFSNFFRCINEYTDLLVKVIEAREVSVAPEKGTDISTALLRSEKKLVHEAFVLKIYVAWEVLVEDVFVECLYRDPSEYAKHKGISLPRRLTRGICRGLISGLGYFDFKDVSGLKGMAKRALTATCNPFARISPSSADKIDEFHIIRNYLSHYSDTSRQALSRMYRNRYDSTFREPGDFLLDTVEFVEFGEHGEHTRFANYTNAFIKAADEMASFLGVY